MCICICSYFVTKHADSLFYTYEVCIDASSSFSVFFFFLVATTLLRLQTLSLWPPALGFSKITYVYCPVLLLSVRTMQIKIYLSIRDTVKENDSATCPLLEDLPPRQTWDLRGLRHTRALTDSVLRPFLCCFLFIGEFAVPEKGKIFRKIILVEKTIRFTCAIVARPSHYLVVVNYQPQARRNPLVTSNHVSVTMITAALEQWAARTLTSESFGRSLFALMCVLFSWK